MLVFFVFAGYFFFNNLPRQGLCGKWLIEKWKRRLGTLLIPYIIWNILAVVIPVIKIALFNLIGLENTESSSFIFNPLAWFITGPADYPLWFMRDLMLLTLITPLLYVIFKRLSPIAGFLVLLVLFALPFDTQVITWRGYFFFSLGAYMGIRQLNILELCKKVKYPSAVLALVFLLTATFYNDAPFHGWLLRAFYPFGMVTFLNICAWLTGKKGTCDRLCKLSSTVFFIYGAHEIFILGWTKGLMLRIFGESLAGTWIRWFFVPIVVIAVCLLLFYVLNRIMPRTIALICGGRSRK